MTDYYLVQFARTIGKTTAQLTLWDMLKLNKWKAPEPQPEPLNNIDEETGRKGMK